MKHLGYIFFALVLGLSATALAGDEQELAEFSSFSQQPVTETGQEAITTETRQGVAAADSVQSADTATDEASGKVVPKYKSRIYNN